MRKIVSDNKTNIFYKICIKCIILEFTVNSRTRNAELFHNARDGNTAIFNSLLQYFTLMRHNELWFYDYTTKM